MIMEKRMLSIKPLFLLIAANLLGMLIVIMNKDIQSENIVYLCVLMCVINVIAYLFISLCSLGDGYLFIIISMLSSIGIIMQTRINSDNGIRQMILYLAGVVCYFITIIVYRIFHKYWNKLTLVYFGISIFSFILTALLGAVKNGSKNWIIIGGVSIQPSEFIRILFVLSLAAVLTNARFKNNKNDTDDKNMKRLRLGIVAVIAYINAFCLLLQREWGIAVLFFAIYLAYLFIYGESKLFFSANILAALSAGFIGVKFMSHIQVRVATWLDPFADATGKGYQILQSMFAISAGGFAGSGIGHGAPYFIPIVSSDFIFSAICEEMGVLGGIAVLLLYFVLVYRGFKIALSSTNDFNKAVSIGLSVMLGVQTFIIVGGVVKLIPLTGITLPFISYGGSSMITTFIALGILQSISSMKGEVTDEIE